MVNKHKNKEPEISAMKTKLLSTIVAGGVLLLISLPSVCNGQGSVGFTSFFQANLSLATVFNTDTTTKLEGSQFKAELWGKVNDSNPANFALIETGVNFLTSGVGAAGPGRFFGNSFTQTGSINNDSFNYFVRAWDSGTGATWDTATSRGQSLQTSISLIATPTPQVVNTENFANFSLAVVPEPTTVVLGVMGGLALLLRRRK